MNMLYSKSMSQTSCLLCIATLKLHLPKILLEIPTSKALLVSEDILTIKKTYTRHGYHFICQAEPSRIFRAS